MTYMCTERERACVWNHIFERWLMTGIVVCAPLLHSTWIRDKDVDQTTQRHMSTINGMHSVHRCCYTRGIWLIELAIAKSSWLLRLLPPSSSCASCPPPPLQNSPRPRRRTSTHPLLLGRMRTTPAATSRPRHQARLGCLSLEQLALGAANARPQDAHHSWRTARQRSKHQVALLLVRKRRCS